MSVTHMRPPVRLAVPWVPPWRLRGQPGRFRHIGLKPSSQPEQLPLAWGGKEMWVLVPLHQAPLLPRHQQPALARPRRWHPRCLLTQRSVRESSNGRDAVQLP